MATGTEVVTVVELDTSAAADLDYWTRQTAPVLRSLLRSAGSYSPADVKAQLRVLTQHVVPNLGPRPSMAHATSLLTQSGSPWQPQINLSSGKPQVRYCWEMLGPNGGSNSDPFAVDAAREILSSLSKALGFSTLRAEELLSAFAPTPKEAKVAQAKIPEWLASFTSGEHEAAQLPPLKRLPFSFLAFDLKGPNTSVKAYFNPKAKEIATGVPATEMTWNVLRGMKPALNPASIDVLEQFLAERPAPYAIELVGIDCLDKGNAADARVKLYINTMSNSFNTVRDCVTLGGRLQDKTTLDGLTALRDVWHLLIQEPEGIVDDDYDKPIIDGSTMCQRLYFSFDLRPGRDFPEVKTYLPTWNYVRSDEETVQNYEEIFRKCGYEWGKEGRYRKAFESAFGPVNRSRPKPVHLDASFLYSEKKGIYQTLYFSPPLGAEE